MTALILPQFAAMASAEGSAGNSIGVRLLEMPANRSNDPRAQVYIVDHLAPGAVIKRRVLITNSSPTPRHIEVFPGAASIDDNAFDALPGRAANELTNWISVDRPALDLAAGQSSQVQATIAVTPDAARGERYGVIWAETGAPAGTSDNVTMVSRVGIRVYLDVGAGGEPPSSFDISDLTPARAADGRPQVLATVRNTGGRALDLAGQLTLSDGPAALNTGPFPVTVGTTLLPGHSGRVQTVLDKGLPAGPWRVRLTLRSGAVERSVTAVLTFPPAANSEGASVAPETWLYQHLLPICLAVLLAGAMALAFLAVRRRRRREAAP